MTFPETLNTKFANKMRGLIRLMVVTHTVDSDAWFDSYGILKSGQGA
jgi:hypothetical protein